MAVTGADDHDFFVFHDESKKDALVTSKPNIELQGLLVAAAMDFWQTYVLTDIPPDLTDRDVKIVESPEIMQICEIIKTKKETLTKKALDEMKAAAVSLAGHPKMKCGNVQISTVLRNGKFSFHKLTIAKAQNESTESAE
jgi:hypothetical protein